MSRDYPRGINCRQDIIKQLSIFWSTDEALIAELPVESIHAGVEAGPLPVTLRNVVLPEWASDVGVAGVLLVPAHLAPKKESQNDWSRIDWFSVAFWYLHSRAEQEHERLHGPIYSYSSRLKGWDSRMWDHAWVNRIALFLRRWASEIAKENEIQLFGRLPSPDFVLTHDVDAIRKNFTLRGKQTAFYTFNALRLLFSGQIRRSSEYLGRAIRFFLSMESYDFFRVIGEIESKNKVNSTYFFYAKPPERTRQSFATSIIDPAYDLNTPPLPGVFSQLLKSGAKIGLHQSHGSWDQSAPMKEERETLESEVGEAVTSCRQHWMMFSWAKTWEAQAAASFSKDYTLGFNDRSGFRNGAALSFFPLTETGSRIGIESVPIVLMDSHLYNYNEFTSEERLEECGNIVKEIGETCGTGSFIWHTQVFGKDYGWGDGYRTLVEEICRYNKDQTV